MHKLKLFIEKLAQVKFIHYICIDKKGINYETTGGTIQIRTTQKPLGYLAVHNGN